MKKFSFKISGHKYDVEVLNKEDNTISMEVNGTQYDIELSEEVTAKKTPTLVRSKVNTQKTIKAKADGGTYKVKCPLPGNIMNIMVRVGDEVKVGDKLLMYEAMKMENLVQAEKEGTVSKIVVNPGDTVLQEDLLMEITL